MIDRPEIYIAAAKVMGEDSGMESEKQVLERLVKKTVGDVV